MGQSNHLLNDLRKKNWYSFITAMHIAAGLASFQNPPNYYEIHNIPTENKGSTVI